MHTGEREFHLGLHTDRTHHTAVRRALGHVLQQLGLADSGLAAQDKHPALTGPDRLKHPVKRRALVAPTQQHCPVHECRQADTIPASPASAHSAMTRPRSR